jgi:predicted GNAT superfamily acetyltransferase
MDGMSNTTTVLIRPLETMDDFRAAEVLQGVVWPMSAADITPAHVLTTAAHNGGLVLGAFEGEKMVGFLFGFLGTDQGDARRPALSRLKHCSHQLGVLSEFRDQDVGFRLKLAQRDFVMGQGVRLITWTFDPLESRNARLNIAKLGAVCRTYVREVYGEMQDGLNTGLPSDRFQVDWWITSARVKERLFGSRLPLNVDSFTSAGATILNPATFGPDGFPRPADRPADIGGVVALAEVPVEFQALKARDLALAQAWRLHTRALFEAVFQSGYVITDFFHEPHDARMRSFYALSQAETKLELSEN